MCNIQSTPVCQCRQPKRCNCKKSRCLKLYCDCFAAGQYCKHACSCQSCLNNADNKCAHCCGSLLSHHDECLNSARLRHILYPPLASDRSVNLDSICVVFCLVVQHCWVQTQGHCGEHARSSAAAQSSGGPNWFNTSGCRAEEVEANQKYCNLHYIWPCMQRIIYQKLLLRRPSKRR